MDWILGPPYYYFHIRIIVGMVIGLAIARLLNGWARMVQHPERNEISLVHLGWTFFMLLSVVHFWWFEFAFVTVGRWTFPLYFFLIFYAALLFFICAMLFPDDLHDYSGYVAYFESRRSWFYGLIAALFVVDVLDTLLKGLDHLHALGPYYPPRQAVLIVLALIGIAVGSRRYDRVFVALALAAEVAWAILQFEDLI